MLSDLHLYFCLETALTLLLLGVWLIYFEAPIDGLFDADDEEVLGDEEMLSLWYGGLNEIYVQARSRWGCGLQFFPNEGLALGCPRAQGRSLLLQGSVRRFFVGNAVALVGNGGDFRSHRI